MDRESGQGEIIVYQAADGLTRVDVRFEGDTVWLTQAQLVDLYHSSKANISEHIKHILEEGELTEEATVRKFRTVQMEGSRQVSREISHYNLDMIIAIGYRVRTPVGTQFRQWATARLKEYMVKGFTLDDERLKGNAGGSYWKELLARIRDIRSSEKMLYRQVLDLYATSLDYDPKSPDSVLFFQIVQNKLHYAAHGHTAAEVVYQRADAEKPFMGLRTFSGDLPGLIVLRRMSRTMCSLTVMPKMEKVWNAVWRRIWIWQRKYVYMQNCRRASPSQHPWVTIPRTGQSLSIRVR